jgi:hypothetical protein
VANRNIGVLIYHPQFVDNTQRQVPLVVFGHCLFGAEWWYRYLVDELVPEFAIALVGTYDEDPYVSFTWLASDMAFLLDAIRNDSITDVKFPLYKRLLLNSTAAGGHSLGGGMANLELVLNYVLCTLIYFCDSFSYCCCQVRHSLHKILHISMGASLVIGRHSSHSPAVCCHTSMAIHSQH